MMPPKQNEPVRTHGLTHIALAVKDAQRSLKFYQDVFSVIEVYRDNGFIQAQTPGSWDVLVFEEKTTSRGESGGIAHFGFRLIDPANIDDAVQVVEQAGGKILSRGEFVPGEPYLFFTDPDGYEVEIWYEPPTPIDPASTQSGAT